MCVDPSNCDGACTECAPTCPHCGRTFERAPGKQNQKYCSTQCRGAYHREKRKTKIERDAERWQQVERLVQRRTFHMGGLVTAFEIQFSGEVRSLAEALDRL